MKKIHIRITKTTKYEMSNCYNFLGLVWYYIALYLSEEKNINIQYTCY